MSKLLCKRGGGKSGPKNGPSKVYKHKSGDKRGNLPPAGSGQPASAPNPK